MARLQRIAASIIDLATPCLHRSSPEGAIMDTFWSRGERSARNVANRSERLIERGGRRSTDQSECEPGRKLHFARGKLIGDALQRLTKSRARRLPVAICPAIADEIRVVQNVESFGTQ